MHVCCVAVAIKMTEPVEQWICIKFCIKLEHSSTETIQMIQKAAAVGSWWLEDSSRQCAHSCIMYHAEFFGKTSNHPGDSFPLQPRFGTLRLLAFPKTKITFEREEISDHQWNSGKYDRAADGDWENSVSSQGEHNSPNRHQLPHHIFLNLINNLVSLPFQRWLWFWEKPEVAGCQIWAVGGLNHLKDLMLYQNTL